MALAVCLAGCLTADGTLESDGTGKLVLGYQAPPGATEESQRALLNAPGITIEALTIGRDRMTAATLKVDDLAAIGKAPFFKGTTVTRSAQGDAAVLTIKVEHPKREVPDKVRPGPTIRLTLPGQVIEANEKAKVDGTHVEWAFALADWWDRAMWELTVRYRPARATGTTTSGAPGAPTSTTAPSGKARKAQ